MLNNAQDWFFLFLFISTGFTSVSLLIFAQFSMRPMEKKMKADGISNDFLWDGVGARVFSYAIAIVLPEKLALRLNRLMDVKRIRSYASKSDWWRGIFFLSITYSWLLAILIGSALGYAN